MTEAFDLQKWLGKQPGPAGALVQSVHQFWKTGLERKRPGWDVALLRFRRLRDTSSCERLPSRLTSRYDLRAAR